MTNKEYIQGKERIKLREEELKLWKEEIKSHEEKLMETLIKNGEVEIQLDDQFLFILTEKNSYNTEEYITNISFKLKIDKENEQKIFDARQIASKISWNRTKFDNYLKENLKELKELKNIMKEELEKTNTKTQSYKIVDLTKG